VRAPAPGHLGSGRVGDVAQHAVEQLLRADVPARTGVQGGEMQGSLSEERRPAQRRSHASAATPPGLAAGLPHRRGDGIRPECRCQALADLLGVDSQGLQRLRAAGV
jgi:hypothetical protein